MKVLVTGAKGFLGRHVVAELLGRGHVVRAMIRGPYIPVCHPLLEIFRGDLRAAKNLPEAFDGIDALIHLAAAVTGGEDLQFSSSVVGTERLLAAMAQAGHTKRLLLASSFSVYDWSEIHGQVTEESPLEKDLYDRDGYAIAKLWQERITRQFAADHAWQLTVLRPGFIWGKGNEYLAGIGQGLGPIQMVFGPMRALPLTHVENCADCFVTALENPSAANQTFNVVDGHVTSVWRYTGEYLRRSGTRGLRLPVPYFLAYNLTRLAQRTSKLIFHGKGKLPSILVPCRFEARFKPVRFPNDKLRRVLHWAPPLNFDECLERTYGPARTKSNP